MTCDTGQQPVSPTQATTSKADLKTSLTPLVLDVGVPLGSYYLLHSAFGASVVAALAWSSVVPAARTIYALVKERELNTLAALMLAVNVAGIAVSLATGNPRMMIAKDSGISSVIAFAILISVAFRRPLMSAGLKPYMTKGSPEKIAAWESSRRAARDSAGWRCCSA